MRAQSGSQALLGLQLLLLTTTTILLPTASTLSIPQQQQQQQTLKEFGKADGLCPLASKVNVSGDGLYSALRFIENDSVRSRQVERLSKAVQVPTTVSDYMVDPYDEGFAPFVELHRVLESHFPLIHAHALVEHVNRLGLIYTFNGTNPSLKPLLFAAHQDVVPIDDPSDWSYPPFAGHFDGQRIWGRGASDCKNVLIGLLSVVEDLLQQNWKPTRTVVLAFGFDEESHGFLGAGSIAKTLEKKYGRDSFEFVLDEGGMGLQSLGGDGDGESDVVYALPGIGEKGSTDLVITLAVNGGHSSVPPPHTGIGIMAEIIYELERRDLFVPVLDDKHPSRKSLECQVRHSPDSVEPWLARALLESDDYAALAEAVASSRGEKIRFTLQTSQATDLIRGGVKTNALPEKISAIVNYRIALHQTPETVNERAIKIISPIASKYNLSFTAFGHSRSEPRHESHDDTNSGTNHLDLSALGIPLIPAPASPTNTGTDATWTRFSGVTRSVFESVPSLANKTVVVSGDIMTGNTDTRFYWGLSRNIYRWSPSRVGGTANIHTVDEWVGIDVHLEAMMLYYDLIRSFDSWSE